jgi:thioredoxin 1
MLTARAFIRHSNTERYENVKFIKIDVDELPELSQELGIRAMPTFMIFDKGEKSEELIGASPPGLIKLLDKAKVPADKYAPAKAAEAAAEKAAKAAAEKTEAEAKST